MENHKNNENMKMNYFLSGLISMVLLSFIGCSKEEAPSSGDVIELNNKIADSGDPLYYENPPTEADIYIGDTGSDTIDFSLPTYVSLENISSLQEANIHIVDNEGNAVNEFLLPEVEYIPYINEENPRLTVSLVLQTEYSTRFKVKFDNSDTAYYFDIKLYQPSIQKYYVITSCALSVAPTYYGEGKKGWMLLARKRYK